MTSRHPVIRSSTRFALGLAVVSIASAACSSEASESATTAPAAPVVQLGGPGQPNRELTPEEIEALPVPTASVADVDFVLSMLPHHAQAVEMTALVRERTTNDRLLLFVERLEISQTDEIALMESWLAEHGSAMDMEMDMEGHQHHGDLMPGMLTDAEMAELAAASGPEFDRLFLERMIRHHDGALSMIADLFAADGGGSEPGVFRMAQEFDGDQRIEIDRMQQLLAEFTQS